MSLRKRALSRIRIQQVVRLILVVTAAGVLYAAGVSVDRAVLGHIRGAGQGWTDPGILLATAIYIVLMALPYVPGMEISVALLIVLGPAGALLVYAATLLALSISYGLGRLVPTWMLTGALGWMHLERARLLVARIHPLPPAEKLRLLLEGAPSRWAPLLLRHRYVALVLVLNLPGNSLLGGGGGIALTAGISRLFRYPAFLVSVALAAAPIPLAVWLLGKSGTWLWE